MTQTFEPVIILVAPQLGENIGTAARAMANFGLTDLRLVNPREGWPSERARAAASRADGVINQARVYDTLEAAIGDLGFVYATTARARDLPKPVVGPHEAAGRIRALGPGGTRVGVLFGRERSGLTNEEVSLADEILTFPVEPQFSSLNIAQAVLLLAYEWRLSGLEDETAGLKFVDEVGPPASKHDLVKMFEHLESALDGVEFFRPLGRRTNLVLGLRAMFQRARLTEDEVRTLRGVVSAFERREIRSRNQDTEVQAPADQVAERGGDGS
jgi:tRNA/rRNA methyltransferase